LGNLVKAKNRKKEKKNKAEKEAGEAVEKKTGSEKRHVKVVQRETFQLPGQSPAKGDNGPRTAREGGVKHFRCEVNGTSGDTRKKAPVQKADKGTRDSAGGGGEWRARLRAGKDKPLP